MSEFKAPALRLQLRERAGTAAPRAAAVFAVIWRNAPKAPNPAAQLVVVVVVVVGSQYLHDLVDYSNRRYH